MEEIQNKKHDENYWMMVLLYFASFLVGLGIIAITAANWSKIPDNAKLLGALAAMALNAGVLAWTVQHEKHVLKQVVACVYAFLIMAVIGLIGQIFHLQSNVSNACLLWSAVSWPLFLVAPRLLWLWLPLMFCGTRFLDLESLWQYMFGSHWGALFSHPQIALEKNAIAFDFLANCSALALFVAYELWMNKGNSENKIVRYPLFFFSGLAMYLLYGRVAKATYAMLPLGQTSIWLATAYILPCLAVGGLIYLLNRQYGRRSFMPIFLLGTLVECLWVLVMINNQIGVVPSIMQGHFSEYPFEISCPLILLAVMTWYTSCHDVDPRDKLACLAAFVLWFVITFGENVFDLLPSLIICAAAAWFAYKFNSRKWFNTAVLAAVVRILAYYADVSDLQHAGIYLIGSGLLIIAVILLLMKYGRLLWEKKDEE